MSFPYCEFSDQELTQNIDKHRGYYFFLRVLNDFTRQFGFDRSYILMKKSDFDKLIANQKD